MLEHRKLREIVEAVIGMDRATADARAHALSPRLKLEPEMWYGRWCLGVERDGDRATAVLVSPSTRRTISAISDGEVLDGFGDDIRIYTRPAAPPQVDVDDSLPGTLGLWSLLAGECDRVLTSRGLPRRVADATLDPLVFPWATAEATFIEALGIAVADGVVRGAIAWEPAVAEALSRAPWPPRFTGKPNDPCPRCNGTLVDVTTISPPGGDYDWWESPNTDVECDRCKRRYVIEGLVKRWEVGGA